MSEIISHDTIMEVHALKRNLEREINRLINEFELATCLRVAEIGIEKVKRPEGSTLAKIGNYVTVRVEL